MSHYSLYFPWVTLYYFSFHPTSSNILCYLCFRTPVWFYLHWLRGLECWECSEFVKFKQHIFCKLNKIIVVRIVTPLTGSDVKLDNTCRRLPIEKVFRIIEGPLFSCHTKMFSVKSKTVAFKSLMTVVFAKSKMHSNYARVNQADHRSKTQARWPEVSFVLKRRHKLWFFNKLVF